MDRLPPLCKDIFGNSYQIISTLEQPHPAAKPQDFFCPELTKTFLRSLKVPISVCSLGQFHLGRVNGVAIDEQ